MHNRTTLAILVIAVLSLSVLAGVHAAQKPAQNPAPILNSSAGTVIVVVRDAAGGYTTIKPTVELTGVAQDRTVYTGMPMARGEEWAFQVPNIGVYSLEVRAPGYKTEQRSVSVSNMAEVVHIDVTLEISKSSHNTSGSTILAPKVREEVQKGKEAISSKHFDEARAHLEKALQLAPTSSEVNYLLGLLEYYVANRPASAEYLEKAVSLDQKNGPAFLALGEVYYQQREYKRAAAVIEHVLELEPISWRAEAVLGSSYYQMGAYEKALEHAQKAIDIGKQEAGGTGFLLAKCLAALGRKEEAIEALHVFLKSQPPSAVTNSAQSLLKQLQEAP